MTGGGKYEEQANKLRAELPADGIILVVFGGPRGAGFEAQIPGPLISRLPALLRLMADEIENDVTGLVSGEFQ